MVNDGAHNMDESIPLVLSKIVTCLADEACMSAISKLSDKVFGLKELPESLEEIRQELIMFTQLLREMDQGSTSDHMIDVNWITELRKMASRADETIDKYMNHALELQQELSKTKVWTVNRVHYDVTNFRELCDEFMEIENGIKQLIQVTNEWLHPSSQPVHDQDHNYLACSRLSLIGADGPIDGLLKFLMDDGMPQLKVLSIVGFAGIGKTALASVLCQRTLEQYESSAFVTVSKWPDMGRILRSILRQVGQLNHSANIEDMDETQLIHQIGQGLKDKRYIIVIDDVWDTRTWETIKLGLPDDMRGSRVMVTTRLNAVAKTCCPGDDDLIYELKPLTYLNSKSLFLKGLSGSGGTCMDTLAEISDEALKMCDGVPSALLSASSLLATKVVMRNVYRNEIMDNLCSAMLTELKRSLFLSCSGPPYALEACSMYLSLFPEKHRIERESLVRKWIAEGFIAEETIANEYFDELINRNVIQEVEHGSNSGEETYRVHPFMLQVLKKISEERNFVTCRSSDYGAIAQLGRETLRLSMFSSGSEHLDRQSRLEMPHIRSVSVFGNFNPFFNLYLDIPNLRVLDLDGCKDLDNSAMDDICQMILLKYLSLKQTQVTEIPPQIADLQYLETLVIRQTQITTLPQQIGELQNLETLDVRQTQISTLPRETGKLQNLKTLNVRQTRISDLPPEIGKLQNLETLDVSQTQISNLPREIGKVHNLKILNARRTQIINLPPEIGKLQNLETLDVRQTRVKELPRELVELPKLAHLHFGQSNSIGGVKLPVGSDKMKSVMVLGAVDARECSAGAIEEIRGLTGLIEVSVMLYDGHADKQKNDELLSSIAKCQKLESLTIYGDSSPSDMLSAESPNFPRLEKLKVEGRFVKVPGWIEHLSALRKLDIRVCKLEPDDLKILGGLPNLNSLALALVGLPRKQVIITMAGFPSLEVFCFDCRLPFITFQENAMPNLKNLQLKLYAVPAGKLPSGIMLLESLNTVILLYSLQYADSVGVRETVDVMRKEAASHANLIELSINGDLEIFLANKFSARGVTGDETHTCVNRVITGTEIKEVLDSV